MKKLFVMAAMVLSSVGAFAQQAAGTTTIQPKVGLNVATIADGDWKAGFAAGAELQHQATDKVGIAVGALYSAQGFKKDHFTWTPGYINVPITLNYYVAQGFALKAGVQPGFMVAKMTCQTTQLRHSTSLSHWVCLTSTRTLYSMLVTTSAAQRYSSTQTKVTTT